MFSSVTSSHFRRICAHFTATWRSWRSLGGPRRAERESPEFIAIDQHQYDFKMVFVLTPQISPEQNSSSQMATLQKRRRREPGAWRRHRIPAAPHHSSPRRAACCCVSMNQCFSSLPQSCCMLRRSTVTPPWRMLPLRAPIWAGNPSSQKQQIVPGRRETPGLIKTFIISSFL